MHLCGFIFVGNSAVFRRLSRSALLHTNLNFYWKKNRIGANFENTIEMNWRKILDEGIEYGTV